jgi:hypothetical protein
MPNRSIQNDAKQAPSLTGANGTQSEAVSALTKTAFAVRRTRKVTKSVGRPPLRTQRAAVSTTAVPTKPVDQEAVARTVPVPTPESVQAVEFVVFDPTAREVAVCGSFNGWSTTATPMARGAHGDWRASMVLAPGRYEYKFYVDGQWMPDLHASENTMNEFGTLNSIVQVPTARVV